MITDLRINEKGELEGKVETPQWDEMYTKDDLVAMLEGLKKEIIELPFPQREPEYMQGYSYCQMNILDYVIQEKINKLKGNENGNE